MKAWRIPTDYMRPVPIPFEVTANGSKIANQIVVVFSDKNDLIVSRQNGFDSLALFFNCDLSLSRLKQHKLCFFINSSE
jgi:hypothetical protein